jgi:hypothetical protein
VDQLVLVGQILSKCLTTEILQKYCPSWKKGNGNNAMGDRSEKTKLFVVLLEHAGEVLTGELKRDLSPDEVILVYNRVQQFLIARGLE